MQKLKQQQKQFEEISKAQEEVTTNTEKLKEQLQSIKVKINHLMITY